MARTQAVYYRARDRSEPVNEFIEALDERKQAALDLQIDRLNDHPSFRAAASVSALKRTSLLPRSAGRTSSREWMRIGVNRPVPQGTMRHNRLRNNAKVQKSHPTPNVGEQ
jgi:hypothetical protein